MMHARDRRGMATPLVLTIILAAAAVAGALYFTSQNGDSDDIGPSANVQEDGSAAPKETSRPTAVIPEGSFQATGEVLAGTTTPFVKFNQQDYDQALREGRVIMLYFFANWCPICKVELEKTRAAFDELELPNLVGFRVSYNDNVTTDADENLARQFGIAYQHTKVIIKEGQQILKNGSSWDKDRYIEELTKAAQ